MSITVRDCLKLPSLSLGKVIAGRQGLDSIVTAVSVMEFQDGEEEEMVTPNELLISALYCVKGDADAQCRMLRQCKRCGDVGLVLFYSDMILGEIDAKLKELADLLSFPIILLPEKDMGLKYSDVISDVMEAVFYDQKANHYFVSNTIERLSQTPEEKRSPSLALRFASDYAKASFFLCDREYNLIASSFWPASNFGDLQIAEKNFRLPREEECAEFDEVKEAAFFHTVFMEKKSGLQLILCAVTHNSILNSGTMSEVVELLQLFTILWNYNLDLSARESVIPALFDGRRDLAERICTSTGIEKERYNRLVVAELTEEGAEGQGRSLLNQLRELFAEAGVPLIADILGTHIVMLYHNGMQTRSRFLEEDLARMLDAAASAGMYTCCRIKNIDEATPALQEYVTAKEAVRKIYPRRKKFSAEDMRYVLKVLRIFQSVDGEKAYYQAVLAPLSGDGEAELTQTLCCYLLDARSSLKTAAELLFVHRNTVLYRLNKIRSLLDCDLAAMPFAYDLYMAVSLYRLGEAG